MRWASSCTSTASSTQPGHEPEALGDADLGGPRRARAPPVLLVADPADRRGSHAVEVLVGEGGGPALEVSVRGGDVGALGQDPLDEALDQLHPVGLAEPGGDEDDHPAVLPEAAGGLAPTRAGAHLDRRAGGAPVVHAWPRRPRRRREAWRRVAPMVGVPPPSNCMSLIDADAVALRKTLRVNFLSTSAPASHSPPLVPPAGVEVGEVPVVGRQLVVARRPRGRHRHPASASEPARWRGVGRGLGPADGWLGRGLGGRAGRRGRRGRASTTCRWRRRRRAATRRCRPNSGCCPPGPGRPATTSGRHTRGRRRPAPRAARPHASTSTCSAWHRPREATTRPASSPVLDTGHRHEETLCFESRAGATGRASPTAGGG